MSSLADPVVSCCPCRLLLPLSSHTAPVVSCCPCRARQCRDRASRTGLPRIVPRSCIFWRTLPRWRRFSGASSGVAQSGASPNTISISPAYQHISISADIVYDIVIQYQPPFSIPMCPFTESFPPRDRPRPARRRTRGVARPLIRPLKGRQGARPLMPRRTSPDARRIVEWCLALTGPRFGMVLGRVLGTWARSLWASRRTSPKRPPCPSTSGPLRHTRLPCSSHAAPLLVTRGPR
jgi:hypothetical protein